MRNDLIYSTYTTAQSSIPNAVTMSDETAASFYAWLDHMVPRREQFDIEQDMLATLSCYPYLLETHSWDEIREIAEVWATIQI